MWLIPLRLANLMDMDFDEWGFWVLIGDNIVYIYIVHFLGETDITLAFKRTVNKLLRKNVFKYSAPTSEDVEDKESHKFSTFQHIDFMFVYIPRILILKATNKWFSVSSLNMTHSTDCSLNAHPK